MLEVGRMDECCTLDPFMCMRLPRDYLDPFMLMRLPRDYQISTLSITSLKAKIMSVAMLPIS